MAEKVYQIIAEHFDVQLADLSESTRLKEDLHADSLDLVELIIAFEDEFSLSVPDDVALSIQTIGDIVHFAEQAK